MEVPVVALAARMKRWAVGGRRSHPLVSFSASRWAETTGRRAYAGCNRVATSVRTPMRPMWSCGDGLVGVGRLMSVQRWNQTRARLSTQMESGATMTRGDLNETACRKAKTLSQSSSVVVNVSEVACFALPGFTDFASSASMAMTLSSSLSSSASLVFYPYFAHSVMEGAKIFRSLPASDSLWRFAASVRNGGRRTALYGVHPLCFFEHVRSPLAAQRRTSVIGIRILSPSAAKVISIFREITEDEIRSPSRSKAITDPQR